MTRKRAKRTIPKAIILPSGDKYSVVLCKILDRDELGRPENLQVIPPDRCLELMGGEGFMFVYVPEKTVSSYEQTRNGRLPE